MEGEPSESANAALEREPPGWMFWSAIAIAPFYVWMVFAFFYESWGYCRAFSRPRRPFLARQSQSSIGSKSMRATRRVSRAGPRKRFAAPPQIRAVLECTRRPL